MTDWFPFAGTGALPSAGRGWPALVLVCLALAGACGTDLQTDAPGTGTVETGAAPSATHAGTAKGLVSIADPLGERVAPFELAVQLYPGNWHVAPAGQPVPDHWLVATHPEQWLELAAGTAVPSSSRTTLLLPTWQINVPIWMRGTVPTTLGPLTVTGSITSDRVELDVGGLTLADAHVGPLAVSASALP
ncbi:MAG: hypothetical protein R3E87_26790 [Burkholderiaceae bacterium]